MPRYQKPLKPVAQSLRQNQTEAERLLWAQIRKKQILGVQFYRQRPIDRFIADFLSVNPPLVIEVDGDHHQAKSHKGRDDARDEMLKAMGYTVLRFTNHQIAHDLQGVLEKIAQAIESPSIPL